MSTTKICKTENTAVDYKEADIIEKIGKISEVDNKNIFVKKEPMSSEDSDVEDNPNIEGIKKEEIDVSETYFTEQTDASQQDTSELEIEHRSAPIKAPTENNLKLTNYKCEFCDHKAFTEHHLDKHVFIMHRKVKKLECAFCNYTTFRKALLKKHTKTVHLYSKCDLCDFRTDHKAKLRIHHESVHLKLKKYECRFCDYRATEQRALSIKIHVETVHLKTRIFKCEFCDYAAKTKQGINVHTEKHLKAKELELDQSD